MEEKRTLIDKIRLMAETEELYNKAMNLYKSKEYRQAFYYINDALVNERDNRHIQELHKKISEHYHENLLGLKYMEYHYFQEILGKLKTSIEQQKPEEARDYFFSIKGKFPSVTFNISFYHKDNIIHFYNGRPLNKEEDITFLVMKSDIETFWKISEV
ncbi:MAG: hypothetical protein ABRQ38_15930 [Candidatus Eremiobacterota bacterium]